MRLISKLSILIIALILNSCALLKNNNEYKSKKNSRKSKIEENSNQQFSLVNNEEKKYTSFQRAEFYIKTYSSVAKSCNKIKFEKAPIHFNPKATSS